MNHLKKKIVTIINTEQTHLYTIKEQQGNYQNRKKTKIQTPKVRDVNIPVCTTVCSRFNK